MESGSEKISISDKKSIMKFIDTHYDIYHHPKHQEELIPPLIHRVEQILDSKQLTFKQKGVMLFFKSALSMMIDKASPQLEKDLLKAVKVTRSRQTLSTRTCTRFWPTSSTKGAVSKVEPDQR